MSAGGSDARAARPPRWCTAEAPAPRPAYNGAAEAYPPLPARAWCRLYRLMEYRGLLVDGPALRLARYLADTDTVSAAGIIADLPAMLAGYMARARVSRQTAYTDLGRLVSRGLVRQVQAAAPGHRARYRLSAPAAMIAAEMPGLPPDLARALAPEPARTRRQGGGDQHHGDGPAGSCAQLDPSPYTREGSPPSPAGTGPGGVHQAPRCRPGEISSEEKDRAASVVAACRAEWRAQRGPHRLPAPAGLARVEALAALALRHVTAGEVRQLLTERVASAADLPGVLAWRIGRVVAAARRPARHVPADEHGARYAALRAARAGNSAHRSTETAGALRQLRDQLGPDRIARRRHDAALAAEQAATARAVRHGA